MLVRKMHRAILSMWPSHLHAISTCRNVHSIELIFCGEKDGKPCCCIPKLPHQHVQTFDAGNQGIKFSVRLRAEVFIPRPDSIFDCTCLNREILELQLSKAYPPAKMHQLNGSGPLDLKTQRQSRATALQRNGPEAASRSSWLGEPGGGLTFLGGTKCNSNPAICRVCRSPSLPAPFSSHKLFASWRQSFACVLIFFNR